MIDRSDLELFKQALIEARNLKTDEYLKKEPEEVVTSEEYQARIQEIIDSVEINNKKRTRRKWIIGLVAALLALLAGCAIYVNKSKIADFVEGLYQKYAKVEAVDAASDNSPTVTELYELTYVPEGYELFFEDVGVGMTQVWTDTQDNKIIFNQSSMSAPALLDAERSQSYSLEINEMKFYCRDLGDSLTYLWTDDTNIFNMTFPKELSEDEVVKIIENIKIKE